MADFGMQWRRGWGLFRDATHLVWENKQLWFLVWLPTIALLAVPGLVMFLIKLVAADFSNFPMGFFRLGNAFYGGSRLLFSYLIMSPFMIASFFIGMFLYLLFMLANFYYAESFLLGNPLRYGQAFTMSFAKKRYAIFWAILFIILILYPVRLLFSFIFAFLLPVLAYATERFAESFQLIGILVTKHIGTVLAFYVQTLLRILLIMLLAGMFVGLFTLWHTSMIFMIFMACIAACAVIAASFYSALLVILLPAYIARDSLELLSRSE